MVVGLPMLNRRSLLLGACSGSLAAGQVAAAPPDWALDLATVQRFAKAGIPTRRFSISGQSLEPALQAGDQVLVDLRAAGKQPARGDLVVFRWAQDGSPWIKRVIGMPGERVKMAGGRLVINGSTAPREPLAAHDFTGVDGKVSIVPRYRETLPDGSFHEIVEVDGDDSVFDNTVEALVPENGYFLLGDNRDRSLDSRDRSVGLVSKTDIVGRVIYRLRPKPVWIVQGIEIPEL